MAAAAEAHAATSLRARAAGRPDTLPEVAEGGPVGACRVGIHPLGVAGGNGVGAAAGRRPDIRLPVVEETQKRSLVGCTRAFRGRRLRRLVFRVSSLCGFGSLCRRSRRAFLRCFLGGREVVFG